jgi:hypothetical protein
MNHLETLIKQYYEWKGYIVRSNVKVGPLPHGGFSGELDIVAYHPVSGHLLHIEPSLDALSWEKRKEKYRRKFEAGKKHIFREVFPWLDPKTPIEQVAVLVTASRSSRKTIGGGAVVSIDEFVKKVKSAIVNRGIMAKSAIPEQYDLLRTIQMVTCGFFKVV